MKWQNITAKDLHGLVSKISLKKTVSGGRSPHPVFWYYLDDKKTLRVSLPNIHGGSGALSTGFLQKVKENLRLTNKEFADLVDCPLSSDEFEAAIRERLKTQ